MATDQSPRFRTEISGTDLSDQRHRFAKFAASPELAADPFRVVSSTFGAMPCGAGEDAVGVVYDAPARHGQSTTIGEGGILTVWSGASVAAGALIASDVNGRAVTAASGAHVLGTAITSAAAAGIMIRIIFDKTGVKA